MKTYATPMIAAALLGVAGCDGRADTDYHGEPLMSLSGSVHIDNENAPAELVPALAFLDPRRGDLEIVDVDVYGEFPARFAVEVHVPPPPDAFVTLDEDFTGEPRLALGYIAAVSPDHPQSIAMANGSIGSWCAVEPESLESGPCYEEEEWCKEGKCYTELSMCNASFTECEVVERTGDANLAKAFWQHLAGLSRDFMILYLDSEARKGGVVSRAFAGGKSLDAGYHLIKLREYTPDEQAAAETCRIDARNDAYRLYNERHGTNYSPEDVIIDDEFDKTDLDDLELQAYSQRNCPMMPLHAVEVAANPDHPIAVEIGTDVKPLFPF